MTAEHIKQHLKEFTTRYLLDEPYCHFVDSVTLLDESLEKWIREQDEESSPAFLQGILQILHDSVFGNLERGTVVSGELYFYVTLRAPLPTRLKIPETYKGINVRTHVIGEIDPYLIN